MIPGYKSYLNAVALKSVIVKVDVPSVYLGVQPWETLENVEHNQFAITQLVPPRSVDGDTNSYGSYFGIGGTGSMVPEIINSDEPYYGDPFGGA
jgi:hypothetical protein